MEEALVTQTVGNFIDYYQCPVCHNNEAHYERRGNKRDKIRLVICGGCGVVRQQILERKGTDPKWIWGMRT